MNHKKRLLDLPDELLDYICTSFHAHPTSTPIGNNRHLFNLALTCKALSDPALRALYAGIKVTATAETLLPLAEAIFSNSTIASRVKWLSIQPPTDYYYHHENHISQVCSTYPALSAAIRDLSRDFNHTWQQDAASLAALIAFTCTNLWRFELVTSQGCGCTNYLLQDLIEAHSGASVESSGLCKVPRLISTAHDGSFVFAATHLPFLTDLFVGKSAMFDTLPGRVLAPRSFALQNLLICTESVTLPAVANLLGGCHGLLLFELMNPQVLMTGNDDGAVFFAALQRHRSTLNHLALVIPVVRLEWESFEPMFHAWDFSSFKCLNTLHVSQPMLFGSGLPALLSPFSTTTNVFRGVRLASMLRTPPIDTCTKYADVLLQRLPHKLNGLFIELTGREGARAFGAAYSKLVDVRRLEYVNVRAESACLLPEFYTFGRMHREPPLLGCVTVDISFLDLPSPEGRRWMDIFNNEIATGVRVGTDVWKLPPEWQLDDGTFVGSVPPSDNH